MRDWVTFLSCQICLAALIASKIASISRGRYMPNVWAGDGACIAVLATLQADDFHP